MWNAIIANGVCLWLKRLSLEAFHNWRSDSIASSPGFPFSTSYTCKYYMISVHWDNKKRNEENGRKNKERKRQKKKESLVWVVVCWLWTWANRTTICHNDSSHTNLFFFEFCFVYSHKLSCFMILNACIIVLATPCTFISSNLAYWILH